MFTGFESGLGVPQEWLDDSKYGTAFLSHSSLFLLAGTTFLKSHMPKERKPRAGRNNIISATFVSGMLISLSEDDSINIFANNEDKHKEQFRVLFCLGLICPDCGEVSKDANHLRRHTLVHTASLRQCPKCPPGTPEMDYFKLRRHLKLCVIRCSYSGCGHISQTRANLEGHERKHRRSLGQEYQEE